MIKSGCVIGMKINMDSNLGTRAYLNATKEKHGQIREMTEGKTGKLMWEGNETIWGVACVSPDKTTAQCKETCTGDRIRDVLDCLGFIGS